MQVEKPQNGTITNNVSQECHTLSTKLGKISLRTADEIIALNERLIALTADGKLSPLAGRTINGAIANMLRIPEATREGGALAISSDYIEIMEIVRRLRQLPLETQELVVKALFGERVKSEVSLGGDPNKVSCSEHNVQASYPV
jgi:hypothetical protein